MRQLHRHVLAARVIPALLAGAAVAVLAGGCVRTVPAGSVDAVSTALFAAHGLVPVGPTSSQLIEVDDIGEVQWSLPLEASRAIGLDFSAEAGRTLELRTTPIDSRQSGTRAHVLVSGGRAVGAWISVETASGVFTFAAPP